MTNATTSRGVQRRELRTLLRPYAKPSYARALGLLGGDLALFAGAGFGVVLLPLPGKVAASLALALAASRLFVLGHDACHQSFTPSRRLKAWLGRLAFLPTYSTYSLWQAGHNVALTPWRRALYRAYRSWWGAGLYYGHDVWWRQMIFPRGKTRTSFLLDSWLVTLFLALHATAYAGAAYATEQSPLLLLGLGIALPFVVWLYVAAIVFYVHHTDESAHWFDTAQELRATRPNLAGTHDMQLPLGLDLLLHNVMRHTAHHVDPTIPCYRLAEAQEALAHAYGDQVKRNRIGVRRYVAITRRCQLYDVAARRWRTFTEVDAQRDHFGAKEPA